MANFYISSSSDAGAQINAALAAAPNGCRIWLPSNNTCPLTTQIDLDLANISAPVEINGQNAILDARTLDADAIVGGIAHDKWHITIRELEVRPSFTSGNARWGITLGNPNEVPGLRIENVTINGGVVEDGSGTGVAVGDANGIRVFGAYRSWINQLYSVACVEGAWFEQMNAVSTGMIIVRECFADYALRIVRGRSWGALAFYLESNWRAAMTLRDGPMALDFPAIYVENNNRATGDIQDYGIMVGEYDYPSPTASRAEPVRSSRLGGIRQAAPANEWGQSFIGMDQAIGVKISLEQVRPVGSQQNVISCLNASRPSGFEVDGAILETNHAIDLTLANTDFGIPIVNVDMAAADLIDPNALATVLGGRQRP